MIDPNRKDVKLWIACKLIEDGIALVRKQDYEMALRQLTWADNLLQQVAEGFENSSQGGTKKVSASTEETD